MGFNPFKKVRQAAEQAAGAIEGAAQDVAGTAQHAGGGAVDTVGHGLDGAKDAVLHEIHQARDAALAQIESAVPHAIAEAADAIEDAAREALQAVLLALQAGALERAIDLIQVGVPSSAKIKLGPLSMDVGGINDRIDEVQAWAKSPPTDGPGVRALIELIGPTSVSVDLTAYLVTPLGAELTWETAEFLDRLDDIWHAIV